MRIFFRHKKTLHPKFIKNRLLLNKDYLNRKTLVQGKPIEVTIELTNYCNLNCIFCPNKKMKRPLGFINYNLFRDIIDQIKEYVELVDLDLVGESTFHPQIFDIIAYCKRANLLTVLNSNMTAVDGKLAKSLIDAGLDMLVMGIDGVNKETYESIRRGGNFERTKSNIEVILNMNDNKLYKVVQMVYMNINKEEKKEFLNIWREKGADYVRLQPYQNIDKDLLHLYAIPVNKRPMSRNPCIMLWRKLVVCWDGTIVLCCSDYDKFAIIGDVKREAIWDIWNGGAMQGYRQKHVQKRWNELPFCKSCLPFDPRPALIWGSICVDPLTMRRLLFFFEKLKVVNNIALF